MKRFLQKYIDATIIRFIIVGMINTIVGTTVMFTCYNMLHLSYWISTAANYIIGSIVSYFLNKYYTFRIKQTSWKYVVKFGVNIIACYLIAYGIAKPAIANLLSSSSKTIQENVAMLTGMVLFVVLNYCGQRFFAFNSKSEKMGEKE